MAHLPKNIVLCSDGTGNTAIKGRATNVFKLYEAIDHLWTGDDPKNPTIERQLAFYDDGVGTEELKWLSAVTGAFGIGLQQNVMELYVQLARVYQPGDQIYLFGFSRGAFTVRMLGGLICQCGILRSEDMDYDTLWRGAQAAMDAHRSRYVRQAFRTKHNRKPSDKVGVARALSHFWENYKVWLPDGVEFPARPLQDPPPDAPPVEPAKGVRIRFIGVWDTVEAYGFPIAEVADFWDRFIYPYRFPDKYLSKLVDHACHALSIDDERATFWPVLWNSRDRFTEEVDPRIEQVWFAGVHANVGGGYPKQGISLVSLAWMMSKAEQFGLHFTEHDRRLTFEHQNVHDKLYDSRSGAAASFYRYKPRAMVELCRDAGIDEPTLHVSTLERIQARTDEYAPAGVPKKYLVDPPGSGPKETNPDRRVDDLEIVQDIVWWRRVFYNLMVGLVLGLLLFVWWFKTTDRMPDPSTWPAPSRFLYAALGPVLDVLEWVTPTYFESGVAALRHYPACTLSFLGAIAAVFWGSTKLMHRSRDLSFCAWRNSMPSFHATMHLTDLHRTWWIQLAHWVRHTCLSPWMTIWSNCLMPALVILGLFALGIALLVSWLVPAASLACNPPAPPATELLTKAPVTFTFDTTHSMQATPVILVRGEKYRITVVSHTVWWDSASRAGPDGVDQPSPVQEWVGWLRRDSQQEWFKLLGALDPYGEAKFGVGMGVTFRPDRTGRLYLFVNDVFGFYGNNEGTAEIRVECLSAENGG